MAWSRRQHRNKLTVSRKPLSGDIQKDEPSVVKVEGRRFGGIVRGSGFVASTDDIITNAHVVAGITAPYVIAQQGTFPATVVWFDPNVDLAILTRLGA